MELRILKPVGGYGTFVAAAPRLFSLQVGDIADVEDEQARKWIGSGIAEPLSHRPDSAALRAPENAMHAAPRPRTQKARR